MKTINIGIVAHVDAGKTTTTENLLYYRGAILVISAAEGIQSQMRILFNTYRRERYVSNKVFWIQRSAN